MTNKEAINRIKEHNRIHFQKEFPHAIYITEALNMAIDALSKSEELKQLLKNAIADFEYIVNLVNKYDICLLRYAHGESCGDCPLAYGGKCKWKFSEKAMKLIGESNDEES